MFSPDKPFLLAGSKSDIRQDKQRLAELDTSGQEPVTELEALNLYEEIGAYSYIETSAYCNIGIRGLFQETVAAVWPKVQYKFETQTSVRTIYCTIL